jgi:peptide/nickel transport system substrate-binding protein
VPPTRSRQRRPHRPWPEQHRSNEVSGDYQLSILGAAFDFDDPIDTFGQLFVTKGGRWYQKRSVPEVDKLYEQQKFMADPEERKKVVLEMDKLVINDLAYLILQWFYLNYMRRTFVKGWTATPNIRSTHARIDYVWLDLPELPCSR